MMRPKYVLWFLVFCWPLVQAADEKLLLAASPQGPPDIISAADRTSETRPEGLPFEDVSSATLLSELGMRGLDPLSDSAPAAIRDAFVEYDFSIGGGHNLAENPASLKSAERLSVALAASSLQATVRVRTALPGARVRFRLVGRTLEQMFPRLTNDSEDQLPIGLYYIWAERNNVATSSRKGIFRIVQSHLTIDLEEINK